MPLSRLFLALLLFAAPLSAQNLKLEVAAEEPTGVFFDRDTLDPQTPILFTARLQNPASETRQITLTWRVSDAAGKTVWERGDKWEITGKKTITRRELFDPPARGGFSLQVSALARQKGKDLTAQTTVPFAVLLAPSATAPTGARPQSFFVTGAPANLSDLDLDFYTRIGARVLRSPLPADPANPDWSAVETQLGLRVRRNLASIALLPLGNAQNSTSEAFWARSVPANLARFAPLTAWELSGDVAPADLDAWAQIARSKRSDVTLLGPVPDELTANLPAGASVRLRALDGATFEWPALGAHPAALRRLWLSRAMAARGAGVSAIHLRRETAQPAANSLEAAGDMAQDYIAAVMAGAASLSEPIAPPNAGDGGSMARGAAFAMVTRTLEDASFREDLFPRSPALEGALFKTASGSVAALWSPLGNGTLTARVAPARAFDIFGNPLATDQKGALRFPVSGQPVYVLADVPTDVLAFALRNARVEDLPALQAQILPLSRVPGDGATGESPAIRVRLQNVSLGTQKGQVRIDVPKGWKLTRNKYDFELGEGEVKTYEFRTAKTVLAANGLYPMSVTAGKLSVKQTLRVASAENIERGAVMRVDGDLSDWGTPQWMEVKGENNVAAKVALKWDANRLWIAAQVRESALSPRRADEPSYEFWKGHDALQLAFGFSNGPETVPAREPFRDSDRGFLLCPFNQKGPAQFEGRILKLWSPDKPYGTISDRTRWGGAVTGASCAIVRDEPAGLTTYEARLPLSALPELQPLALAAKDGIARFGWILHTDEGVPLDWGAEAGNFPWWDNTSTFLPEGTLTSSLRATLGFTQHGDVDLGLEPVVTRPAAPSVTAPVPPRTPTQPSPRPTLPPLQPAPQNPPRATPPPLTPFLIPPSQPRTPPVTPAPAPQPITPLPPAITPAQTRHRLAPMPVNLLPPVAAPRGDLMRNGNG